MGRVIQYCMSRYLATLSQRKGNPCCNRPKIHTYRQVRVTILRKLHFFECGKKAEHLDGHTIFIQEPITIALYAVIGAVPMFYL